MRTVVIGVGNVYRGDDGVGPAVAERIRSRGGGIDVRRCEQEASRLLDAWDGAELALVVDAVSSGAPPGTVHRFEPTREPIPSGSFRGSTHAFGVAEAVELARALGRLPARLVVFGVEGAVFEAREGLSPAVAAAVEPLVERLLEEAGCTSVP